MNYQSAILIPYKMQGNIGLLIGYDSIILKQGNWIFFFYTICIFYWYLSCLYINFTLPSYLWFILLFWVIMILLSKRICLVWIIILGNSSKISGSLLYSIRHIIIFILYRVTIIVILFSL